MRPNTSVRQPVIAGVRGQTLSDLLRTWRSQPRQRSAGLFWSLIALAFAVDTALILVAIHLLGLVESAPKAPAAERRMYVPHTRNAPLWEPLRHWIIRVDGQPRIFESFCREAVRAITGTERFEDNDPLPLVVAWMLHDGPGTKPHGSSWEDYPCLRCDDPELRPLLYRDEQNPSSMSSDEQRHGTYVEPAVVRHSKRFHQISRGIAAKGGAASMTRLSLLEKQALRLEKRLTLFDRIRSGLDGGDRNKMESPSAALREAYASGDPIQIAPALADFIGASRRALPVDKTARNRLACEDWLNERHPFRKAMIFSLLAAGLLTLALLAATRRPAWRRGLVLSGLIACAAGLGSSAAGFSCRSILHGGIPVSEGSEAILWASSLAMGLGLALTLRYRDTFPALAGALASTVGFVFVELCPPTLTANWPTLPSGLNGNAWLNGQVLAAVSAYAALALAWSIAALTLGRLMLAPPSGERLREIAALCARTIGIGLALLVMGAILGAFRATEPGSSWHGWDAPALGAFFALPLCAFLLYARRVGWLQPFGLLLGLILGFTAIVMAWHTHCRGIGPRFAPYPLKSDVWLYGASLVNLSLIAHAALRYYFGKRIA